MGLDKDDRHPVPHRPRGLWSWSIPLAIVALSLAAELGGDAARQSLRYGRAPIADGEAWRLVTGHLVHLGWSHFLMNAVALLLIWALVGHFLRLREWLLVSGVAIAVIDLGFWFRDTSLDWYVGLSGLLHALLCAGIVAGVRRAPVDMAVLGALITAKLAYEQWFGALPGSAASAGGAVVVNAHLYGAAAGAAVAILLIISRGRRTSI